MMSGSTVMGFALKRIGYPLGFAVAGSVALVALVLFLLMIPASPLAVLSGGNEKNGTL